MNIAVLVVGAIAANVLALARRRRAARRLGDETPQGQYRSMVADLHPKPQRWRAKRVARVQKQRRKVWAAGAAGAVGLYGSGTGGFDAGSGRGAGGGCGGAHPDKPVGSVVKKLRDSARNATGAPRHARAERSSAH
jgi:hypothetical protein